VYVAIRRWFYKECAVVGVRATLEEARSIEAATHVELWDGGLELTAQWRRRDGSWIEESVDLTGRESQSMTTNQFLDARPFERATW